jgi:probable addiction module antidote protein
MKIPDNIFSLSRQKNRFTNSHPRVNITFAEYLSVALNNPDPDAFLDAVRDVAKAQGISTVAQNAGLGRESLYKALKPGAKPRFETIRRLLTALDVKIEIVAS